MIYSIPVSPLLLLLYLVIALLLHCYLHLFLLLTIRDYDVLLSMVSMIFIRYSIDVLCDGDGIVILGLVDCCDIHLHCYLLTFDIVVDRFFVGDGDVHIHSLNIVTHDRYLTHIWWSSDLHWLHLLLCCYLLFVFGPQYFVDIPHCWSTNIVPVKRVTLMRSSPQWPFGTSLLCWLFDVDYILLLLLLAPLLVTIVDLMIDDDDRHTAPLMVLFVDDVWLIVLMLMTVVTWLLPYILIDCYLFW